MEEVKGVVAGIALIPSWIVVFDPKYSHKVEIKIMNSKTLEVPSSHPSLLIREAWYFRK